MAVAKAKPRAQGRIAQTWRQAQQRPGALIWKRDPQRWDESKKDTPWFCAGVAWPHDKPKMVKTLNL
jgi:hypothetical protein